MALVRRAPSERTQRGFEKAPKSVLDERRAFRKSMATFGDGVKAKESKIPDAGLGLFATRDFAAGDPVTIYEGVAVPWPDASERALENPEASHYRTLWWGVFIVDGAFMPEPGDVGIRDPEILVEEPNRQLEGWGGGAFVNDGTEDDINNVKWEFKKFGAAARAPVPDKKDMTPWSKMVYFEAAKDIEKGEEIYVNYGTQYRRKRFKKVEKKEEKKFVVERNPKNRDSFFVMD